MTARPLRVAVLCSHRAPGLPHLLNLDPRRGVDYEVVCCVSSQPTFGEEVRVERRGVPCLPHPIREFCTARGTRLSDLDARAEYDAETLRILEPYHPDILVLDGYLLLLTSRMLDAFQGRVLNVHHADLALRNDRGEVAYPGLRAVRDAIIAGETELRATAHIATSRLDDGPILLRSWVYPVPPAAAWARRYNAADILRAVAFAQQEWMLREAWGPMLAAAIQLAGAAFVAPDAPLDVARIGRWALERSGRLVPDGTLVESMR